MSDIKSNKRVRRTKANLEKGLFEAAINVIGKVGFQELTVTSLMKEAKAEAPVFYNRYTDMTDFIDKFVRNYDYWLNDSVQIDAKNYTPIENMQDIMIDLVDQLADNVCMQKLLAWEMSDNNFITRRTAQNRDNNSESLISYFKTSLKNYDQHSTATIAILIGGIYYLVIHREVGTFNGIDFSTKEGMNTLKSALIDITEKLFQDTFLCPSKEAQRIAIELMKNGVSTDVIQRSTGLSENLIISLGAHNNSETI